MWVNCGLKKSNQVLPQLNGYNIVLYIAGDIGQCIIKCLFRKWLQSLR